MTFRPGVRVRDNFKKPRPGETDADMIGTVVGVRHEGVEVEWPKTGPKLYPHKAAEFLLAEVE